MTQTRVTQEVLEVVSNPTPPSRVTQLAMETVSNPTPPSRISQLVLETLVANTPLTRVSQLVLETLVPNAASVDLVGAVGQLWPRGGGASPGGLNVPSGPAGGDLDDEYTDPTVVGLKSLPLTGTLSANQVWARHPTNPEMAPYTPGTPTLSHTVWDPFIVPSSPHSLDEEFNSTSLAAFTTIYTGDAGVSFDANTTVPGSLWLELPDQLYRIRAFMKALPGDTNYTIHSAVSLADHARTDGSGCYPSIFLTDSVTPGSGSQTGSVFAHTNGYGRRGVLTWAGWGNTAASAAVPVDIPGGSMFMFLRLRKQSGVYYFGTSIDGVTWHERSSGLLGGVTPTHFGIGSNNYSGQVARISFPYLRYYANGTQLNTGALRNVYS